jgi:hypothetical protein
MFKKVKDRSKETDKVDKVDNRSGSSILAKGVCIKHLTNGYIKEIIYIQDYLCLASKISGYGLLKFC